MLLSMANVKVCCAEIFIGYYKTFLKLRNRNYSINLGSGASIVIFILIKKKSILKNLAFNIK